MHDSRRNTCCNPRWWTYTCTIKFNNNTRDLLTAVPMAFMTALPICPCLYRGFLWVWCHYDIIKGERGVHNCTTSYWSVSFTQMSHMTMLLFWLTVIGSRKVTWPNVPSNYMMCAWPLTKSYIQKEAQSYWSFRDEIAIIDEVTMKGIRIIILTSLQIGHWISCISTTWV